MEEPPLCPLVLGGDHSISYPVVWVVIEHLRWPVDILHLDAHPYIYHSFEGNKYLHASSFAQIMEGVKGVLMWISLTLLLHLESLIWIWVVSIFVMS